MESLHHSAFELVQGSYGQPEQLISRMPNPRKPKRKNTANPNANPKRAISGTRQRDWTDGETSALLEFVNLPEYRPQRRTRNKQTDWVRIVQAMEGKFGRDPAISVKRCKERMKTLTGDRYFREVTSRWERMKEGNGNLIRDDLRRWIVSSGLRVDWYEAIEKYKAIQGPCYGRESSLMQTTDWPSEDMDPHQRNLTPVGPSIPSQALSVDDDPSEPIQTISPRNVRGNLSVHTQFVTRFNSLNKLQMSTLLDLHFLAKFLDIRLQRWSLLEICECLSIVQNRSCLTIYEDVIALKKMGFFDDEEGEGSDDDEEITAESDLDISGLLMHEKFFKKAVERNPAYDSRRTIRDDAMVTFDATLAPSGVTMLLLSDCEKLEVVDLSGFRELRFLGIEACPRLREMIGCECPEELGWLEIRGCPSFQGYPPLQKMPSLQEFGFYCPYSISERGLPGGELDVSGCVRLRTLEIVRDQALSSIRGLEGLRSLTALEIWECEALRSLPDIGHMKDLTYLSIESTSMEEIKGVEKLSNLDRLYCGSSELKALPDLSHLPHLESVDLYGCPVVDDPSSAYYNLNNLGESSSVRANMWTLVTVSEICLEGDLT